ncbi:MAG TPA: site-2 protease family protein [Cytophagaceae bacterium]|nr:site-2 protease family protein [Cytophagaceae bacterium]
MLRRINPLIIQSVLFVLTIFTTTLAGAHWVGVYKDNDSFWAFFSRGFEYSIPFLGILTIHELGHYFTAKYYKVDVTLPYYIPFYLPGMTLLGTMGAFIKMNSRSASKKEIFDIGVAGPLAGFFAALIVLTYGFLNLPEPTHIYSVHPEYQKYGLHYADSVYTNKFQHEQLLKEVAKISDPEEKQKALEIVKEHADEPSYVLAVGNNLLFSFFENYIVQDKTRIPNAYELYHYPYIFAGFLALFFTALNLIPIGQLDGGHVMYGLLGYKKHKIISTTLFVLYIFVAGLGIFKDNIMDTDFFSAPFEHMVLFAVVYLWFLYFILERVFVERKTIFMIAVIIFALQFFAGYLFPDFTGFPGWMLFGVLLGRMIGTEHPPAFVEEPLDTKRKLIGWFALLIFVLCFTPKLISMEVLS